MINNNIKQMIGYRGDVTIDIKHGSRTVKTIHCHNIGKAPLFEFFARCLMGDYEAQKLPKYLRVFYDDTDCSLQPILMSNNPSLGYSTDNNGDIAYTTLSFVVPYSLLKSNTINKLKIYSSENYDTGTPSAEFALEEALHVAQDSNIVIAWKMVIGNIAV